MTKNENRKLLVLIERHFVLETHLAELVEELNEATAAVLKNAGIRGPSSDALMSVQPLSEKLHLAANKMRESRDILLSRIEQESGERFATVSDFIQSLSPIDRLNLDGMRRRVLERCSAAQVGLVQNQASVYYTHEFHRNYLAGVLNCDPDDGQYGPSGTSSDVPPGNLYGRTC